MEMAQTTGALLNVGSFTRFPTWAAVLCSSQGPVRVRGGGGLLAKLEQLLLLEGLHGVGRRGFPNERKHFVNIRQRHQCVGFFIVCV